MVLNTAALKMFDRCVLINLKRRPERLANFRRQQLEIGWPLPSVDVFEAIDGNRVGVPDTYTAGGGAWGCLRSHVSILERAVMDGIERLLVLEDDVCWKGVSELQQFLRTVPDDWDMLMLGGQHMEEPQLVMDGIVRCNNCQRTHAYAIRGDAMKDLLKLWYGCTSHIDHWMGPWQRNWKVYSPTTFVFGQSGGRSDISGSLNPAKYWTPPERSQVVWLSCPLDVAVRLRGFGLHMGYDREGELDRGLNEVVVAEDRKQALKNWIEMIQWEAASDLHKLACVYHPGIAEQEVREVASDAIAIVGETLDVCLSQLKKHVDLRPSYSASHLVLLRSHRSFVRKLAGFHAGYYIDEESGADWGLKIAAEMRGDDRLAELRTWVTTVGGEAERMGAVPLAWHEALSAHELELVTHRKVITIEADSMEELTARWQEQIAQGV